MTIFVNLPGSLVNSGAMVAKNTHPYMRVPIYWTLRMIQLSLPFYASRLRRNAEGFSSVAGKRKTVSLLLRKGQSHALALGQVQFTTD
jgi:hypothetical protein